MSKKPIAVKKYAEGVAVITLDRAQAGNALDEKLVASLAQELDKLDADKKVRVVVLGGAGESFCCGRDAAWTKPAAEARIADLMDVLNRMGKPTIARVHGAVQGDGAVLVACCDIAIASRHARFCLSGVTTAAAGPLVAAIGERMARRYLLTGEELPAAEVWRIGLVHDIVEAAELDEVVLRMIQHLLQNVAAAAMKKMLVAGVATPFKPQHPHSVRPE